MAGVSQYSKPPCDNTSVVYPNTFDKLHIGPAGNPEEAPVQDGAVAVMEWCHEQGWDTMELAFVQQVWLRENEAEKLAEASKRLAFPVSCHGSYYINMASPEPKKVGASRGRIESAAKRIVQAGGHSVVYHSAFNMGRDSQTMTALVIEQTRKVEAALKEKGIRCWLRPELTGKETQHGDLAELIKVCNAVETALPCIDFSHLHARYNGPFNSYGEWCEVLDKLESGIKNKNVLQRMHIHLSGIEYGPKGEKRHLPLSTSDLRYKELMQALKQAGVCGTLVCEAPRLSLVEDIGRIKDAWDRA